MLLPIRTLTDNRYCTTVFEDSALFLLIMLLWVEDLEELPDLIQLPPFAIPPVAIEISTVTKNTKTPEINVANNLPVVQPQIHPKMRDGEPLLRTPPLLILRKSF